MASVVSTLRAAGGGLIYQSFDEDYPLSQMTLSLRALIYQPPSLQRRPPRDGLKSSLFSLTTPRRGGGSIFHNWCARFRKWKTSAPPRNRTPIRSLCQSARREPVLWAPPLREYRASRGGGGYLLTTKSPCLWFTVGRQETSTHLLGRRMVYTVGTNSHTLKKGCVADLQFGRQLQYVQLIQQFLSMILPR